jgi:Glycosyl transferase family 2
MNEELDALERKLEIRDRELADAHSHIASLEQKLLKLKQYRRELKLLKEERRRLRKSAERRVGQILLAPYRLLQKPATRFWRKVQSRNPHRGKSGALSEYQQWFEQHRASAEDLACMRHEVRAFASQPLISILTPVFDTPVGWLDEAVESVLAQVYENWELLLVDDGSTDSDLLRALPALSARDRRIRVVKLDSHKASRPH